MRQERVAEPRIIDKQSRFSAQIRGSDEQHLIEWMINGSKDINS